jgi:hypothetical protein
MLDAASPRASRLNRYRVTTTRLKARRGSEQYQAMNSSMANSYALRDSGEPRLLRTADLEWSRSRSRSTPRRGFDGFFPMLTASMPVAAEDRWVAWSGSVLGQTYGKRSLEKEPQVIENRSPAHRLVSCLVVTGNGHGKLLSLVDREHNAP